MNRAIKLVNKAYNKKFKQLHKNILATNTSGLFIFVEHLRYLRDIYVLADSSVPVVASLNKAIEEFELYKITKNECHWNNFCNLIKLNMKEWLAANDTV